MFVYSVLVNNSLLCFASVLSSLCQDWVDLDDECSALKSGGRSEDDIYQCYSTDMSGCSIWPSTTCSASLSIVTVTSIDQNYPACVHSIGSDGKEQDQLAFEDGIIMSAQPNSATNECDGDIATFVSNCESKIANDEIDAIICISGDCQKVCADNDDLNLKELLDCYEFIQDCQEITKSLCSLHHCCLDDNFMSLIHCHTGCLVECDIADEFSKERSSKSYVPEVCQSLPDEPNSLQINDSDETHASLRGSAFVSQCALALGVTVIMSLALSVVE